MSPAGRDAAIASLRQLDRIDGELDQLRRRLLRFSARQAGRQALQTHYGIGPLTGVAIWEELGDTRRFPNSTAALRHSGLDITRYFSDTT